MSTKIIGKLLLLCLNRSLFQQSIQIVVQRQTDDFLWSTVFDNVGRHCRYCTLAPKGIRASFAILKHCKPSGMPMRLTQQIRPITR